jgi:hypothetical protein
VKGVGEVNDEGLLMDKDRRMRLSRVCGLTARQRVSINLSSFDELTKDEKQQLFDNCVQAYVEYPEELKEKGKKLAMKNISHSWRTYKSKLAKCWRNNENPFDKYKDLTQKD